MYREPRGRSWSPERAVELSLEAKFGIADSLIRGTYIVEPDTPKIIQALPLIIDRFTEAGIKTFVFLYHSLAYDLKVMAEQRVKNYSDRCKFLKISYGVTKYVFRNPTEGETMGSQMGSEIFAETGSFDHTVFIILGYSILYLRDKLGPNELITSEFWRSFLLSIEPMNTTNFTFLYDKQPSEDILSIITPLAAGKINPVSRGNGLAFRVDFKYE